MWSINSTPPADLRDVVLSHKGSLQFHICWLEYFHVLVLTFLLKQICKNQPYASAVTNYTASYTPISLLPILSKVLEKILLKRLVPIIDEHQLIPKHKIGFMKGHGTIEEIHRLVNKIYTDFENRRYCSAVTVDLSQAFYNVWHLGLFYKLKCSLPHRIFYLLKYNLTDRTFFVKYEEAYTKLYPVLSGVPQRSILGAMLYSIFTADLPETRQTMLATYADDTTILASHEKPTEASRLRQTQNGYNNGESKSTKLNLCTSLLR
jgi:hypothetical protein